MNSEAKIQIGGKQGEERNPDWFLGRIDDDGQRRALISLLFSSLLFSSLPLPLPLCSFDARQQGVVAQGGVLA